MLVRLMGENLDLQITQSTALANQFKPAILQCFGDIAGAIGGHFETYLSVVAQVSFLFHCVSRVETLSLLRMPLSARPFSPQKKVN